jgi:hypothetical protein
MKYENAQTLYLKHTGELGTKPTKQIASIHDLNNYLMKLFNDHDGNPPNPFYYKYPYISLLEGIYKKVETKRYITYEIIKEG